MKFEKEIDREETEAENSPEFIEPGRVRIISEESEEYRAFRAESEKEREKEPPTFGDPTLSLIDAQREASEEVIGQLERGEVALSAPKEDRIREEREECEKKNSAALHGAMMLLRMELYNPNTFRNMEMIFKEAMEDPDLKAHFESAMGNPPLFPPEREAMIMFLGGEIPQAFAQRELIEEWLFKNKKRKDFENFMQNARDTAKQRYGGYVVPDAIFEKMLRKHRQRFQEESKRFESEAKAMMEWFRNKVMQDIASGTSKIDPAVFERRMAEVKVVPLDPMLGAGGLRGGFDPKTALVSIRTGLTETERRKLFAHEMRHALAGRIISYEVRNGKPRIIFRKIGLGFERTTSEHTEYPVIDPVSKEERYPLKSVKYGDGSILTWLDEAYTEISAVDDVGEITSSTYVQFREMLKAIQDQGVDINLLGAAYYENDDPSMPSERRKSAWKAFSENLRKAYPGDAGSKKLADTLQGVQVLLHAEKIRNPSEQLDLLNKK